MQREATRRGFDGDVRDDFVIREHAKDRSGLLDLDRQMAAAQLQGAAGVFKLRDRDWIVYDLRKHRKRSRAARVAERGLADIFDFPHSVV